MTRESIEAAIRSNTCTLPEYFSILNSIASLLPDTQCHPEARRLLLLLLEFRNRLPQDLNAPLNQLLREVGLYPYMTRPATYAGALDYEFHRSKHLPSILLHDDQLRVSDLLGSQPVILSAPMSFGKSLLIEELVASGQYNNIVIIEPTLALIDEMRTKLKKYSSVYNIVFAKNQPTKEKNLFLLTQERLVEYENLPQIDFFVIDEFYKLCFEDPERSSILNHAFYVLKKQTSRYYLLGPMIESIPATFLKEYECKFIHSNFHTVRLESIIEPTRNFARLTELLKSLSEPTLIYCAGPGYAETNANKFAKSINEGRYESQHQEAIAWARENIHEDWTLGQCLKEGVAFHHGDLPRHFSKYIINAFNSGNIQYLFCTTTLIEGVNTSAKNVVIYDKKKGLAELTEFDIRNISGRAGRMGKYFSGRVFYFITPPKPETLHVDIPWYTQDNATNELLIQLDKSDLKADSAKRIQHIVKNDILSLETIRKNSNISPEGQIALAQCIASSGRFLHESLCWTFFPETDQVYAICELIWTYLVHQKGQEPVDGISSAKQLGFLVNRYRTVKSPKLLIETILQNDRTVRKPNDAVRKCMKQIRKWYEFRFPKLLMTVDAIQREVYLRLGLHPGSYSHFAAEIENGFAPANLAVLRELGVPHELILKLSNIIQLSAESTIEEIIVAVKNLVDHPKLHAYERIMLSKL